MDGTGEREHEQADDEDTDEALDLGDESEVLVLDIQAAEDERHARLEAEDQVP